jgi:hypothetical protein
MSQIGSSSTISCGVIKHLPTFIADYNWEEELEGMKIATRYQLDWQSTFT